MRVSWIRTAQAAVTTLAAVTATVALGSAAQAQAVDAGNVAISGGPGDFVTGGGSYKYDTAAGDWLGVDHYGNGNDTVTVDVSGSNGDWWTLDFAAPSGQELAPGTTYEATKYPFNGTGAGLSLIGNGRSCEELTGSFTVLEASFGQYGYVERFAATFEQHCAGSTDPATGEVHIVNPPPPAPLTIGATTTSGTFGKVNGNAYVGGAVTCSEPVGVALEGTVTQVVKGMIVRGEFTTWVDCGPDAASPWTATVRPDGTTPFRRGKAEVVMTASAYDVDYDETITDPSTTIVRLTRA